MTRRYYSNLAAATTLSGSLSNSATTTTVGSLSGYPTTYPYTVAIDRATVNEELVLVTNSSGATATIQRAYGGTTAKSHDLGATFEHVIDATDADEANAHVNASTGVHGLTGAVVGTTDAQTVSGKTLNSTTAVATSTDPALVTKAGATGSAAHIRGVDTTGVTTEYQIARGGDATFRDLAFRNSSGTGLTLDTVTASGVVTVGSLTNGGTFTVSNTGATVTGTLTAGVTTATSVKADTYSNADNSLTIASDAAIVAKSLAATGAVTAANLPASSAGKAGKRIHWGAVTGTSDTSGFVTYTHGAGFTPTVVTATWAGSGGGPGGVLGIDTLTATTFRARFSSVTTALSLTVYFFCGE